MIKTSLVEFEKRAKKSQLVPVAAEILGDFDTPVTTFLKTTKGQYRFLLESVEGATQQGRYSIIGDDPYIIFKSIGHQVTVRNGNENSSFTVKDNPLNVLKSLLKKYNVKKTNDIPFFTNGFFGYLGYETIRHIEQLPNVSVDDVHVPDIHMFIPKKIIVFDNLLHKITILAFADPNGNVIDRYYKTVEIANQIIATIRNHPPANTFQKYSPSIKGAHYNMTRKEYEEKVIQAKEHIKRGDTFQIVLSQRLKVKTDVAAFDIYRGLRVVNPSPYMFFMKLDDVEVLGSSPETLVRLEDNQVFVKPIAGTRKRGESDGEDQKLIENLLSDPKEKSEHTMLVDLGRNDIGRIAKYGSVKVTDLMSIEKYSHVIHIVSTVTGTLAKDMDAVDVFKACFPAGTLTGAPKVKAMEIIEKLEPTKRAIYGGAVGYLTFSNDMDVCIAIRTLYKLNGTVYLQAGAGIVADSVPEKEYEETLNKSNALLKAVEYAEGGLL